MIIYYHKLLKLLKQNIYLFLIVIFFYLVKLSILNLYISLLLISSWFPQSWSFVKRIIFSLPVFFVINSFIALFLFFFGIQLNSLLIVLIYVALYLLINRKIHFNFNNIFGNQDKIPIISAAIILTILIGLALYSTKIWFFFVPTIGTDTMNHFMMYRQSTTQQSIVYNYNKSNYIAVLKKPISYNYGFYINGTILYNFIFKPYFSNQDTSILLFNYSLYSIIILLLFYSTWLYLLQVFIPVNLSIKKSIFLIWLILVFFICNVIYYIYNSGFYSSILVHSYLFMIFYLIFESDKNKMKTYPYWLIVLNTGIAMTWHHIFPISTLIVLGYLYKKKRLPVLFMFINIIISIIPIIYSYRSIDLINVVNNYGRLQIFSRNEIFIILLCYMYLVFKNRNKKLFYELSLFILLFLLFSLFIYTLQIFTIGYSSYAYYKSLHTPIFLSYIFVYIFIIKLLVTDKIIERLKSSLWLIYIGLTTLLVLIWLSLSNTLYVINPYAFKLANTAFGDYQQVNKILRNDKTAEIIPIYTTHMKLLYMHALYPKLSPVLLKVSFNYGMIKSSGVIEQYIKKENKNKKIILLDSFKYFEDSIDLKQYRTYKELICENKILIFPTLSPKKCQK